MPPGNFSEGHGFFRRKFDDVEPRFGFGLMGMRLSGGNVEEVTFAERVLCSVVYLLGLNLPIVHSPVRKLFGPWGIHLAVDGECGLARETDPEVVLVPMDFGFVHDILVLKDIDGQAFLFGKRLQGFECPLAVNRRLRQRFFDDRAWNKDGLLEHIGQ